MKHYGANHFVMDNIQVTANIHGSLQKMEVFVAIEQHRDDLVAGNQPLQPEALPPKISLSVSPATVVLVNPTIQISAVTLMIFFITPSKPAKTWLCMPFTR